MKELFQLVKERLDSKTGIIKKPLLSVQQPQPQENKWQRYAVRKDIPMVIKI